MNPTFLELEREVAQEQYCTDFSSPGCVYQ